MAGRGTGTIARDKAVTGLERRNHDEHCPDDFHPGFPASSSCPSPQEGQQHRCHPNRDSFADKSVESSVEISSGNSCERSVECSSGGDPGVAESKRRGISSNDRGKGVSRSFRDGGCAVNREEGEGRSNKRSQEAGGGGAMGERVRQREVVDLWWLTGVRCQYIVFLKYTCANVPS